MALDGCGLVCKYILIIFNIIFAVVGFAFLGLGLWLRFSDGTRGIFQIQELNNTAFVTAVTVLIVLGALMLFVVAFGDYGACNEKRCALNVFAALLSMLALAEVVIGVLAYTQSDEVGFSMAEFYSSMYALYITNGDPVIGATLTFIHKMLHCCGASGVVVLELAKKTCPRPDSLMENLVMPNCPGLISDVFVRKSSLVMGIFIATGALLMTALICTIILLKQLKRVHQEISAYYTTVY